VVIRYVSETGSTNADLAAALAAGERVAEGHWLVADRQHAGHGRQGRVWLDATGNFMGSTVVHGRPGDPPLPSLALACGLALHKAIVAVAGGGTGLFLKWPNDAMIGPAKLAGILLERQGDCAVVGIGVNLAHAPPVPGRETVSLASLGREIGRNAFAEQLADSFDGELAAWRNFGLAGVIPRWLAVAHPVGTDLVVGEPGETPQSGKFAGLDAEGALILALADGTRRTIHAGEIRLATTN